MEGRFSGFPVKMRLFSKTLLLEHRYVVFRENDSSELIIQHLV